MAATGIRSGSSADHVRSCRDPLVVPMSIKARVTDVEPTCGFAPGTLPDDRRRLAAFPVVC